MHPLLAARAFKSSNDPSKCLSIRRFTSARWRYHAEGCQIFTDALVKPCIAHCCCRVGATFLPNVSNRGGSKSLVCLVSGHPAVARSILFIWFLGSRQSRMRALWSAMSAQVIEFRLLESVLSKVTSAVEKLIYPVEILSLRKVSRLHAFPCPPCMISRTRDFYAALAPAKR